MIGRLILAAALLVCVGCDSVDKAKQIRKDVEALPGPKWQPFLTTAVRRIDDRDRGVVCYVTNDGAISCLHNRASIADAKTGGN